MSDQPYVLKEGHVSQPIPKSVTQADTFHQVQIPETFLISVAKRELRWITEFGRARLPFEPLYRELYSLQESRSRRSYQELVVIICKSLNFVSPAPGSPCDRPIIRHPDLQPNNIFVSDSFDVVSLIDWQHCSVLPLFLQAGPPKYFQNYGDEDSESFVKPQLPADFDHLNEEEKEAAKEVFRRRQLHYYYFKPQPNLTKTILTHGVVLKQKLFQHAGDPWEGDSVTFKADLIRASQCWQELINGGTDIHCPLIYSTAEIDECLRLKARATTGR